MSASYESYEKRLLRTCLSCEKTAVYLDEKLSEMFGIFVGVNRKTKMLLFVKQVMGN